MNEILTNVICLDSYDDSLTLGPTPGIVDGCDITIESADVLMQVAIGKQGENYWHDREYRMRPGSRHVDNVCGVRFRNYLAGAQARVTAALTGPALPRFGPIIPIAGAGVGDPILTLTSYPIGAASKTFGPFDVGDWRALRALLKINAGLGAQLDAQYVGDPINTTHRTSCWYNAGATGSSVARLLAENVSQEVNLIVTGGDANTVVSLAVAPCSLLGQPLNLGNSGGPLVVVNVQNFAIGAGATQHDYINAFLGKAVSIFRCNAGGPLNLTLDAYDYQGNLLGRLADQQATTGFTIEHPLVPCTMAWTITNPGGAANYNLSTVIKEPAT